MPTKIRPWQETVDFAALELLDPPSGDDLLRGIDPLAPDDDSDARHLRNLGRMLGTGPVWRCPWLPASVGRTLARGVPLGEVSGALVAALARDVIQFHRHPAPLTRADREAVRAATRAYLRALDPDGRHGQRPPLPVEQAIALWQQHRGAWRMNRRHVRSWPVSRRRDIQHQLLRLEVFG